LGSAFLTNLSFGILDEARRLLLGLLLGLLFGALFGFRLFATTGRFSLLGRALRELLHAPRRIDELLLARVERVACGTELHAGLFDRGTDLHVITTGARNHSVRVVFRVDVLLHKREECTRKLFFWQDPPNLLASVRKGRTPHVYIVPARTLTISAYCATSAEYDHGCGKVIHIFGRFINQNAIIPT